MLTIVTVDYKGVVSYSAHVTFRINKTPNKLTNVDVQLFKLTQNDIKYVQLSKEIGNKNDRATTTWCPLVSERFFLVPKMFRLTKIFIEL